MFVPTVTRKIFRFGGTIRQMSYHKVNGAVIPFPTANQIPRRVSIALTYLSLPNTFTLRNPDFQHVYIMAAGMFAVWIAIPNVSFYMINAYRKKLGED